MKEVKWIVVTEENAQQVFDEIRKSGRPVTLFAVTDEGYENVALNLSSIRAYIQQQKAIILAYENYYQQSQEALDKAEKTLDNVKSDVDAQQREQERKNNTGLGIFRR